MADEESLGKVPVALSPRDRFVEYLQSRGMRVTQQRLALVDTTSISTPISSWSSCRAPGSPDM
jgi:hypothetical protein